MAKYKLRKSFISTIMTVMVVSILLLAGPASAVRLKISGLENNQEVSEDGDVSFDIAVDIEDEERVPVDNITLTIGTDDCTFLINGSLIEGGSLCSQIEITSNNNYAGYGYGYLSGYGYNSGEATYTGTGYGYGYGYADAGYGYSTSPYGEIIYTITYSPNDVNEDTDKEVSFKVSSENNEFVSDSTTIIIIDKDTSGSSSNNNNDDGDSIIYPEEETLDEEDKKDLEGLGISKDDVDSLEKEELKKESIKITVNDLKEIALTQTEKTKQEINNIIGKINSGEMKELDVEKTYTKVKINKNDGTGETYTKVSVKIPNGKGLVTIVEIIPKEFAESVSELIFDIDPEVIEEDPVVKWVIDSAEVSDISYYVNGVFENMETSTISTTDVSQIDVVDTTVDDNKSGNLAGKATDTVEKSASVLWIVAVLVLVGLIIAGLVVYFIKKK